MSKRNLQKSTNPKKKKDKFTEIETFIRKISVPNSHENQVIRNLINAANQGEFSYTGKVANELYRRLTSVRTNSQTGIVRRPLIGKEKEKVNNNEGIYELSWQHAFKPGDPIDLTCFSPNLPDKELITAIHNNLLEFLFISTYKARKDKDKEAERKDLSTNDSDECR